MSLENTSVTEDTETSTTQSQAQEKTFTQAEVNAILAKTKSQLEKKLTSRYEELGDPDELREIVTKHRKNQEDYELRKGNFDKVLQDVVAKKDLEIQKRDRLIEQYRVETPILEAASRYRAVNAEQVKALVRSNVRLNSDGEVEVLDSTGQVKYKDNGHRYDVDSLVQDFLRANPHFVSATPGTTAAASNVGRANGHSALDVTKLDMNNPEDRARYKEWRKQNGIR